MNLNNYGEGKMIKMKLNIPDMRQPMPAEWYHLGEGKRRIRWSLNAGIEPTFVKYVLEPFLIALAIIAFLGVQNCADGVEYLIYSVIKLWVVILTLIITITKIFWYTVVIIIVGSWLMGRSLF